MPDAHTKEGPAPEAQPPALATVLPMVVTLPGAAPAQATPAAPTTPGPVGEPEATPPLAAAALPGAGKTSLVVSTATPQDTPRQATPATVPPAAPAPGGAPVSQAGKASLTSAAIQNAAVQETAPQNSATASNPPVTAAPASDASAVQPAASQPLVSLSLPSLVIAAAPAQANASSADNQSGSGSGPIPAAPMEQASGPAAGKPEGNPTSSDTPDRSDRGASFQIHLTPDAGPQTALAASTRPVPVAAAGVPQAVPAPAVHAPVPAPPAAQVESGVRWMLKSGAQEAHLQLHPDSLGQVTIHLRVVGGEVHARLWVSEAASVKAVQEGRPHLELSLKEQGLQLGSFDLQQGHRPFQEAATPQAARFPDRLPLLSARQEPPAPITPTLLNPHQIELYA